MDTSIHIGKFGLNNLHVDEFFVELFSFGGVKNRIVEGCLSDTKSTSAQDKSLIVEALHENVDSFSFISYKI